MIVVVPATGRGAAACCLLLHTGAGAEPAACEGLARVAARAALSRAAPRMADLGATTSATSSLSTMRFTIEAPPDNLAAALTSMTGAIADHIPDETFARAAERRLAEIALESHDPAHRARTLLNAALFHPAERASRPIGGTPATIRQITPAAARAFLDTARHGPATLITSTAAVLPLDQAWLPGLNVQPEAKGAPRLMETAEPRVEEDPRATQTTFALGLPIPGRRHPDWPALCVLAHILGGGLASRLNVSLRERRGRTYGLTAAAVPVAGAALLLVEGAVRAEHTTEAIDEVTATIAALHHDGPTGQECADAIRYLTAGHPIRHETARHVVAEAATRAADALPPLDAHLAQLAALTPDSVTSAAVRHLSPTAMRTGIVTPCPS